jgi:hypothetical protein
MRGVRALGRVVAALAAASALTASGEALAQAAAAGGVGTPAAPPSPAAGTPPAPPAASRAAEQQVERPPDADDPMPPIAPSDATYRHGFQVGVSLGLGPGASNGFPADARKVGRAAFYTESGVGLGTYGAIWIGGALADGFAFGVGAGAGRVASGGLTSDEWNILFHADVYPLFSLGGALRDLGAALEAGTAFETTENEAGDVLVDGNGAAYVGGSIFWEGLSLWRLRSGPFVGGHYLFSETVRRPMLLVGLRAALTTGP